MPGAAFVASAFLQLPLAIALLVVGAKLHKRSRAEGQGGMMWFAAFWVGMGAYALAECVWSLTHLAGVASFAFALFVLHVKLVGTVVGFAGLICYLLAIHSADPRLRGVIVGAYGVVLALTETHYSWREPIGQMQGTWGMRLVYERASAEPWWTLLLLILFLPPIVAAISYATLLRHARDPELRHRIGLTSVSLFLFFAPTLLGWLAGNLPWWGGVEKLLALATTIGMVLALWPPPGMKRRFLESGPVDLAARHAALVDRAHDLV